MHRESIYSQNNT